jgi:3-hydroxyisobutyrate dehydrogenase
MEAAVGPADIVLTLTAASASRTVAESAVSALGRGTRYADLTSSAPDAKRALHEVFAGRDDVALADVAILGPVIQLGTSTPLMAVGPAAQFVADLMTPLGAQVEVVDGRLGDAMAHKLLRSIFMKGLAAAVVEAVYAGQAAGFEDWIRGQIVAQLSGDGASTIDRFLRGSKLHAARRSEEMDAAAEYVEALGVAPIMSKATAAHLRSLEDQERVVRDLIETRVVR